MEMLQYWSKYKSFLLFNHFGLTYVNVDLNMVCKCKCKSNKNSHLEIFGSIFQCFR